MYRFSQFVSFWVNDNFIIKISIKIITLTSFSKEDSLKLFLELSKFFDKSFEIDELKEKLLFLEDYEILINFLIKNNIIIEFDDKFKEVKQLSYFTNNPQKYVSRLSNEEVEKLLKQEHDAYNKSVSFSPTTEIWKQLLKRESYRNFSKNIESINIKDLEEILFCAYWNIRNKNGIIHKTTPSAWCFYNISIYYIDIFSGEISIYNWSITEKIEKNLECIDTLLKTLKRTNIENPIWIFFITWNMENSSKKYWLRSYNFSLLEAWHIAQNIWLVTSELWYYTCEFWWMIETYIEKILWFWKNIYLHSIVLWKK